MITVVIYWVNVMVNHSILTFPSAHLICLHVPVYPADPAGSDIDGSILVTMSETYR